MTGTFGGALAARRIAIQELIGNAVGEVEVEQQVLVLKRIHVTYELAAPGADRETVDRVHAVHHQGCPVYRSIHRAID
ncbi:MAG: OsmC family protein, partial [Thermoanaerobaculia bacterium]